MIPPRLVFSSARADERLARAARWLIAQGKAREVLLLGTTLHAVSDLARNGVKELGSAFGWHRMTLVQLAWALAEGELANRERAPASTLAFEAISARVVHGADREGALGRFSPIAKRPGLPRALARTFLELRSAGVHPRDLDDPDLARLFDASEVEMARAGLADQTELFAVATEVARRGHPLVKRPVLLLDIPAVTARERELLRALVEASPDVLATAALGDDLTLASLRDNIGLREEQATPRPGASALERLQAGLFVEGPVESWPRDESVVIFSAPGESRECVEIVRRIQRAAADGVPFDRMAVVTRAPLHYRAHLTEAFRRGGVLAHFARGTTQPDPSGRAFLSLLTCAATGLPASTFAEFLSLGEMADTTPEGAPPPPRSSLERWVPSDDGLAPPADATTEDPPEERARVEGSVRAPRLWERLVVDAAVIGGLPRWQRRLAGLARQLEMSLPEIEDPESGDAARIRRDQAGLAALTAYALPLLSDLDDLPAFATWEEWLERLGSLATRALRRPDRVLAILAELVPMGSVGPVDLREVRVVLERRLGDAPLPSPSRRYGRVFVGSPDEVRGQTFDVVFVPGLAEKLFPQRVVEDPIVPDRRRRGSALPTNRERALAERLQLRLAVGAAAKRVFLSYPRLDVEQSRPRTPSFYGLEVLRAAEGSLPGFDELSHRADVTGALRVGWPAPHVASVAIDDAEHDLAVLDTVLQRPTTETQGSARYLLDVNTHLARALRFRGKRWRREWTDADGLLLVEPEVLPALAEHSLRARSYSPTGLQNYAACPYRFVLQAIHRLAPREAPAPLEELDPLQRGSLIHEVQFELYSQLRTAKLLPIVPENLEQVRDALDAVLAVVVRKYKDDLAPAIEQVWDDGVGAIRADLREWLRLASLDPTWRPEFFELSFGLTSGRERDPNSTDAAIPLDCGILLRGSMNLVERDGRGALRATDSKTGKARAEQHMVIGGGEVLQPVLYALALEKLLPGERVVGGDLYFCTTKGNFSRVPVYLDDEARAGAVDVARAVGDALDTAFLPAAPAKGACRFCDYRTVCGPYEEKRVERKPRKELALLDHLRRQP